MLCSPQGRSCCSRGDDWPLGPPRDGASHVVGRLVGLFRRSGPRDLDVARVPQYVVRRRIAGESWRGRGRKTASESRRGRGRRGTAGASWRGHGIQFFGGSPGAPSEQVRPHARQRSCTTTAPFPRTVQQLATTGESWCEGQPGGAPRGPLPRGGSGGARICSGVFRIGGRKRRRSARHPDPRRRRTRRVVGLVPLAVLSRKVVLQVPRRGAAGRGQKCPSQFESGTQSPQRQA